MSDQVVSINDEPSYSDSRKEKISDRGVLHVEIFETRGIKGDEIGGIGKADPYLKLEHVSSSKREILKSTAHQG
ncbi:hypothetical protein R1sor_004780 [Riccia sorocarpa]|uniref:C2 domain-containing protein n=1 Tax=Riccia sorocarpa TaxID=122646 RepID=A0ABD3HP41_9MARC